MIQLFAPLNVQELPTKPTEPIPLVQSAAFDRSHLDFKLLRKVANGKVSVIPKFESEQEVKGFVENLYIPMEILQMPNGRSVEWRGATPIPGTEDMSTIQPLRSVGLTKVESPSAHNSSVNEEHFSSAVARWNEGGVVQGISALIGHPLPAVYFLPDVSDPRNPSDNTCYTYTSIPSIMDPWDKFFELAKKPKPTKLELIYMKGLFNRAIQQCRNLKK
jgi:hypothetical protein